MNLKTFAAGLVVILVSFGLGYLTGTKYGQTKEKLEVATAPVRVETSTTVEKQPQPHIRGTIKPKMIQSSLNVDSLVRARSDSIMKGMVVLSDSEYIKLTEAKRFEVPRMLMPDSIARIVIDYFPLSDTAFFDVQFPQKITRIDSVKTTHFADLIEGGPSVVQIGAIGGLGATAFIASGVSLQIVGGVALLTILAFEIF